MLSVKGEEGAGGRGGDTALCNAKISYGATYTFILKTQQQANAVS